VGNTQLARFDGEEVRLHVAEAYFSSVVELRIQSYASAASSGCTLKNLGFLGVLNCR